MAQTKIDLSDNKVEQLSNEILHLSGCTYVFGQFIVQSGSTLSILPNHGIGKVLTSDSGGTATWEFIPTVVFPITGATNGLSVTGKKIKLGGALTGNTTIDILTNNLYLNSSTNINRGISLNQTGNELKLSWGDAASACTGSISVNDLNVSLSSLYAGGGCAAGLEITHVDNRICFNSTGSNKTYHDNRGFHYLCDYSGGADSRWLPDKGYVDSKTSGNTSASGERITKLICQVSHGFNVKDVIGWSGGTYNKAIANGLYDGEVLGIVTKCYNTNCFDLTQAGYITGLTGLVTSTTYFLSDVTAGLLISIEPTGNTHISKSVLIANSSTSGWVLPYAGYVITSGASVGGSFATITGEPTDNANLAIALNGKLPSGGTAICATTAGNALALCGCTPVCFLGATACATDSAKLNNKSASYYLNTGSTALCATTAGNALCLNSHTEANLSVNNSACLGGHLPAYYLASGGTALCATTAGNALCLGGVLPAGYLLSGGTAKNSLCLNGHTEAALSVCNSVCVNGHAEGNLSVANSVCLNGHPQAYYLLSGGTAICATCAGNADTLDGVQGAGYLLSGGTAKNSLCLGGALANTYAPLASPNFTTCICTPVMCSTGVVKGTIISGSTCVESPVIQLTTGAAAGCVFTSNATGCGVWCTPAAGGLAWSGSTANGVGTYYSASKICSNANMTFDGTKLGVTGNICASTCLCSPIVFGTTCLCGGIVCATTIATAACTIGTTCLCSPVVLGSTCVCGAIVCSNTCIIAGTCVTGTVACFSSCVRSPLISGGTVCATGNMTAICFIGILCGTACCAVCAGNATTVASCSPSCFLAVGGTAVCATTAGNALSLGGVAAASYAQLTSPSFVNNICVTNASNPWIMLCKTNATARLWYIQAYGDLVSIGGLCVDTSSNTYATDFIASSDCRLKKCIKPIIGALSTVMKLQGVCYELCDDEKHENNIGLIAQSVQKVLPEVVSHSTPNENDAKYGITDDKLGIKYDKFSAIIIEAMKEQQKQIEENKKQINALCLELNYMRNYNKE